MKDYLGYENQRNRDHAGLYTALVRRAFGADKSVMVAHHLVFDEGPRPVQEIPSADTLMFDHDIMCRVFPGRCHDVMRHLASVPADQRDDVLAGYVNEERGSV